MTWTYNPTTARGQVRMLVTDTRTARQILSDEEIDACLSMNDNSILLAAAQALEMIANDLTLVFKITTIGGTRVDTASAAQGLRDHAAMLRQRENAGAVYPVDGASRARLL